MKKVFIIHGFEGKPNGGWRPWLMGELEKLDVYACALAMPDPFFPKCADWISEISRHIPEADENVFLVGHSLGVPAILRYLEAASFSKKFGGVFLVSGPCEKEENPDDEKYQKLKSFYGKPFAFESIKNKAQKFAVIHGEDDQMVDFSHAKKLSKVLDCQLVAIKNGGHLNGASGWKTLPHLLELFS